MLKTKLRQYIKLSNDPQPSDQSLDFFNFDDNHVNPSSQKFSANVEREVRELRNIVKTLESELSKANDISGINDDSQRDISSKIAVLEHNINQVPAQLSSFSCLGQILAIERLESTNKETATTLTMLKSQEDLLKKQLERETRLNNELKSLASLLRRRLNEANDSQPSSSAMNPDDIISRVKEKQQEVAAENKTRSSQLQQLLENVAAPIIVAGSENLPGQPSLDLQDVQEQLNELVLALLNEMFMTDKTTGYVEVPESYGALVKFLLNGDLITIKPDDPRLIRLREFGI